MKYRKKPVVVEAWKLYGGEKMPNWYEEALISGAVRECVGRGIIEIDTLEGTHRAKDGDYIIRGVAGELYPCKPDIFEQTYEEVEK